MKNLTRILAIACLTLASTAHADTLFNQYNFDTASQAHSIAPGMNAGRGLEVVGNYKMIATASRSYRGDFVKKDLNGIANPDQKDKILFYVPIQNAAAATSGDYEQYFIYQNIKYSHNINPKTGIPLKGVKSVSVFSPSAELSDALATAIYVKGTRKGIEFVNQLPNTHCIIISEENKVFLSKHLNYETALI